MPSRKLFELGIPRDFFYFRNRLFFKASLLYEYLWISQHSGRNAAIATGVKPQMLSVWNITGDGDALAIGGNHFIHAVRRNIDINIILFNNAIYGLTKGQYSPTSEKGFVTRTSPFGTIEEPCLVGEIVIGAKGKFFARTFDANVNCHPYLHGSRKTKGICCGSTSEL